MNRRRLIIILLCLMLSACGEKLPEMVDVRAAIDDGGVSLARPTGPMAGIMASAQAAANASRESNKPQIEFLETEDKSLVTIYRFEEVEQAEKVETLLMDLNDRSEVPEAFAKIVPKQKIVRVKNVIVVCRFKEDAEVTAQKIEEALANL